MSSSFAVNGVPFYLDPTEHGWTPRSPIGRNGTGHPIYPAVREYEMRFQLTTQTDYWQFQNWFLAVGVTGTVVMDLPTYGVSGAYVFSRYSGCVLSEPESKAYFNEHKTDVFLLISNIRT